MAKCKQLILKCILLSVSTNLLCRFTGFVGVDKATRAQVASGHNHIPLVEVVNETYGCGLYGGSGVSDRMPAYQYLATVCSEDMPQCMHPVKHTKVKVIALLKNSLVLLHGKVNVFLLPPKYS